VRGWIFIRNEYKYPSPIVWSQSIVELHTDYDGRAIPERLSTDNTSDGICASSLRPPSGII